MHNNITKLYLSNFLTGLGFWYGIENLFMRSIVISAFGISINSVVFLFVMLLLDVPAGVLADRWSRKYTLCIAILMLAVGTAILGSSHSLAMYLVGTVVYALYVVMTSGTFQAITYDSLKTQGREKEYGRIQGATYAAFLSGIFLASLASGFIGKHISLSATYYITLLPCLANLLVISTMAEPMYHKELTDRKYFAHMAKSFRMISSTHVLRVLALVSIAVTVVKGTQTEYGQLYYLGLHLDTTWVGVAYGFLALAAAVGSIYAHKLGAKLVLLYPVAIVALATFALLPSRWLIIAFLTVALLTNAIQNQTVAQVQDRVSSTIRATTISALSFTSNLLLVPVSLLFGYFTDRSNVFVAYRMVLAFAILALATLFVMGYAHFSSHLANEENLVF